MPASSNIGAAFSRIKSAGVPVTVPSAVILDITSWIFLRVKACDAETVHG